MEKIKNGKTFVERLEYYWGTYAENNSHLEHYNDKTFIEDALYGIAIAIDYENYRGKSGYERFKRDLFEFLKEEQSKNQKWLGE